MNNNYNKMNYYIINIRSKAFIKFNFLFFLFLNLISSIFAQEDVTIGAIYNLESKLHQKIMTSFESYIWEKGHLVKHFFRQKDLNNIKQRVIETNCSFIFAIGNKATKYANESNIPGLFILVYDPFKMNLINEDSRLPVGKLTGIDINTSPNYIYSVLKTIFPSKKTKIGFIYNPKKSGHIYNQFDFENQHFNLINKDIYEKRDALIAFSKLINKIDLFIGFRDTTIFNKQTIAPIFKHSIEKKIPIIGFNSSMTKLGALMSFYNNNDKLAIQAANIILELINGKDVESTPLTYPKNIEYNINKKIANIMKIQISKDILDKSTHIIK
ncbi:hypothetical protein BVX93_01625 [bacterium B13(2017)]|nr:hypothetical protein BVX93_01625 [bacterium B13(2017)]